MQNRDEKLLRAHERHGKPFAHEMQVKRGTRQSYLLRQLNRLSAQPAPDTNVIAFGAANKEGRKCKTSKTR